MNINISYKQKQRYCKTQQIKNDAIDQKIQDKYKKLKNKLEAQYDQSNDTSKTQYKQYQQNLKDLYKQKHTELQRTRHARRARKNKYAKTSPSYYSPHCKPSKFSHRKEYINTIIQLNNIRQQDKRISTTSNPESNIKRADANLGARMQYILNRQPTHSSPEKQQKRITKLETLLKQREIKHNETYPTVLDTLNNPNAHLQYTNKLEQILLEAMSKNVKNTPTGFTAGSFAHRKRGEGVSPSSLTTDNTNTTGFQAGTASLSRKELLKQLEEGLTNGTLTTECVKALLDN